MTLLKTFRILIVFLLFHNTLYSSTLVELEQQIKADLLYLNQPAKPWIKRDKTAPKVLDVAIVGGGMAGMTAALALKREGISEISLFDENSPGKEGPWITCARMRTLRSSKEIMGPALGLPKLTFRAWYESLHGEEAWKAMGNIPTRAWQDYLCWYRDVLGVPIVNKAILQDIRPLDSCLELVFKTDSGLVSVCCRKVILATGREGIGGHEIPDFMGKVSTQYFAHTGECIDCCCFQGHRVVVIGAGASAFDAAATAMENGAEAVDMLIRRHEVPSVNKFSKFSFPGMLHGFFDLDDEMKLELFGIAFEAGTPPSQDSVERVKELPGVSLHYNVSVKSVEDLDEGVVLRTTQGDFGADFIILGTGYAVDIGNRAELRTIGDKILLWRDKVDNGLIGKQKKLANFPYLGRHFQFLERDAGSAPYLKDIYCFNYGAFLSHGLISGDITGISIGATKLAQGIATDFFLEDLALYKESIMNYSVPLFKLVD